MTKSIEVTVGVAAVAIVAWGVAVTAQMPGPLNIAAPKRVEIPATGVSLAMQDFGGRPVVEVFVNDKGPFRFILDTGANISVASIELDKELAFPRSASPAMSSNGPAPQIVRLSGAPHRDPKRRVARRGLERRFRVSVRPASAVHTCACWRSRNRSAARYGRWRWPHTSESVPQTNSPGIRTKGDEALAPDRPRLPRDNRARQWAD